MASRIISTSWTHGPLKDGGEANMQAPGGMPEKVDDPSPQAESILPYLFDKPPIAALPGCERSIEDGSSSLDQAAPAAAAPAGAGILDGIWTNF